MAGDDVIVPLRPSVSTPGNEPFIISHYKNKLHTFFLYAAGINTCNQIDSVDTVFDYVDVIEDWRTFCQQLGVKKRTIAKLTERTSDKLYGCLEALLDLGHPYNCWEKVAAVLCGPPFYNKRVGLNIVHDKDLATPSKCKSH